MLRLVYLSPLISKAKHISLLFLGLFLISLVPFNALHRHEEDEHLLAAYAVEEEASHHCELDELQCEPILGETCHHQTHISKPLAKCFSCNFAFIKHFFKAGTNVYEDQLIAGTSRPIFDSPFKLIASEKPTSRGPPSV